MRGRRASTNNATRIDAVTFMSLGSIRARWREVLDFFPQRDPSPLRMDIPQIDVSWLDRRTFENMTTEEYAEYLSEHWCRNQKRVGKIRKLYMQRRWREQRLRRVSRTQKEQV